MQHISIILKVVVKIKYKNFRDQCYSYIKENGPQTSAELIAQVRTKKGRYFTTLPKNSSSLGYYLRRDERFCAHDEVCSRGVNSGGKIIRWGVVN